MEENEKQFENEMNELKEQIDQQQETPVTHNIDEQMQQMGYLWDRVHSKLKADNICFHTKKPLIPEGVDPKDVKIHVLEAGQADPGIVAFVSISDEAMKEIQEIQKKKLEEQQQAEEIQAEEKKE